MSKLHKDEDASDKKIPKIICDLNNNLIYSSRNPLPGSKNSQVDNVMKQVCIYAFPRKKLKIFLNQKVKTPNEKIEDLEILRFIDLGFKVKMIKVSESSIAVDTKQDLKKVIRIFNNAIN